MMHINDNYTIQKWLESAPQGYLENTVFGDSTGDSEPEYLLNDDVLLENEIRTTVQIIGGERCALAVSAGLVNCTDDYETKLFLASQTLDEARHVEVFTKRLMDLGVKENDIEGTISTYINPNLIAFSDILMEKVDKRDFSAAIVGQNIMLEGMAFSVFELLCAVNSRMNSRFSSILSGVLADERRHVGFGENYLGSLVADNKNNKSKIEKMQKDMSYHILASFASSFKIAAGAIRVKQEMPKANSVNKEMQGTWGGADLNVMSVNDIENVLGGTLMKAFKERLTRIGLDYQTPVSNTFSANR